MLQKTVEQQSIAQNILTASRGVLMDSLQIDSGESQGLYAARTEQAPPIHSLTADVIWKQQAERCCAVQSCETLLSPLYTKKSLVLAELSGCVMSEAFSMHCLACFHLWILHGAPLLVSEDTS